MKSYEIFVILILTLTQFTVVLDFIVISPLCDLLMKSMNLSTTQFGLSVSAYAFSAGFSGLMTAGFADRFDRKKLLLFFYIGFIGGTLFCGLATSYSMLLLARTITGIFGGVIGSIIFAIITDIFKLEVRGRVMGFVQMAFASSQVLGLPIGLYFANLWGWHSPFIMIVLVSLVVLGVVIIFLKPINDHLKIKTKRNAFVHLGKTASNSFYLKTFAATTLLATGGFMMMPFGTVFGVNNLKISPDSLPLLYTITGIFSMILGPLIGRASDGWGKYRMFFVGSVLMMVIVIIYCNLGPTPLWMVVILNVIMFAGISARMISSQALLSAIPEPSDRGAFMSINASVQQISGGIAAYVAGLIVVQTTPTSELLHYDILGYVVAVSIMITIGMMWFVNRRVMRKLAPVSIPVNP